MIQKKLTDRFSLSLNSTSALRTMWNSSCQITRDLRVIRTGLPMHQLVRNSRIIIGRCHSGCGISVTRHTGLRLLALLPRFYRQVSCTVHPKLTVQVFPTASEPILVTEARNCSPPALVSLAGGRAVRRHSREGDHVQFCFMAAPFGGTPIRSEQ